MKTAGDEGMTGCRRGAPLKCALTSLPEKNPICP